MSKINKEVETKISSFKELVILMNKEKKIEKNEPQSNPDREQSLYSTNSFLKK